MEFSKIYGSEDPKQEAKWFEFNNGRFLIAPSGNVKQQQLLQETFSVKELMEIESQGYTSTAKTAKDLLTKLRHITASAILLDWEGVTENDQEVKYSVETAHKYLSLYQPFMEWVAKRSEELAQEKLAQEDQVAKK